MQISNKNLSNKISSYNFYHKNTHDVLHCQELNNMWVLEQNLAKKHNNSDMRVHY